MRARTLTAAVVLVGSGLTAGAGERPTATPTPLGGNQVATAPAPRPLPDHGLMFPRRSRHGGEGSLPEGGITIRMPRGAINAYPIPGTSLMVFTGPGLGGGQPAGVSPKAAQPQAEGAKSDPNGPLSRAELDRRIAHIVYDAAAVGTDLWSMKNYEGTFRLYQGTVAAVVPLLDHHPKLAELAMNSLRKSANMKATDGAFVLREAMDAIQKETAAAIATAGLWDRLGGEKAVRAVVKDFVAATAKNPAVDFTQGGRFKADSKDWALLEAALVEAISEHTGGPLKQTGTGLKGLLAGTKLTDRDFAVMSITFKSTMRSHQVPDAEFNEMVTVWGKLKPDIVGQ